MSASSESIRANSIPGFGMRRPNERDHSEVVAVIRDWWGLPASSSLPYVLPRLFFQHFSNTSLLAEDEVGLAGFLIGFHSSAQSEVAYIHFVGVRPDLRRAGLARGLYEMFFAEARAANCHRIAAITAPSNRRSQAFHAAMGFSTSGDADIEGALAWRDYDGPGEHRVVFSREL